MTPRIGGQSGHGPEQNDFLKNQGGLLTRYTDANEQPQTPTAVRAGTENLSLRSQIAYTEMLPSEQPVQVTFTVGGGPVSFLVPLTTGATRTVTAKPGPAIAAIYPSAAAVFPRSVAPGSLISIYGSDLALPSGPPEVTISGQRMPISYAAGTQINSVVPENASGLVKAQVKTTAGQRTVNLIHRTGSAGYLRPGAQCGNGCSRHSGIALTSRRLCRAVPYRSRSNKGARRAELGGDSTRSEFWRTALRSDVCGPAPGYPGLDQINCQISATLQATECGPSGRTVRIANQQYYDAAGSLNTTLVRLDNSVAMLRKESSDISAASG